VHSTKISRADRAALENLWDDAGTWVADTWTRHNTDHFAGALRFHGVVFGLIPHGDHLGHTYSHSRRITLHPSLLDPHGEDPWSITENSRVKVARSGDWDVSPDKLGAAYATDVLLHEMVHVKLFDAGIEGPHHNEQPWCDEIMRITPQLGLDPVKAAPVKPRRIKVDGVSKVVRRPLDGHLSRIAIASWPHSLRPVGYYTAAGRRRVAI
jgi:hypothetical protein